MRILLKPSILGIGLVASFSAAAALGACNDTSSKESASVSGTGAKLTVDIVGDTDVQGVRFVVQDCNGGATLSSTDKDLEDIVLPGGIAQFQKQPFDANSQHLFADYFAVLDPGCYDVTAIPLAANGAVSADCTPGSAQDLQVVEGQTVEGSVLLQCDTVSAGAIDVVAALNHAPTISGLTITPSKFLPACEQFTLCATASDPDGDPIEMTWQPSTGATFATAPQVISTVTNEDGSVTQCVQGTAAGTANMQMTVTAYDLLWSNGALIRYEQWLAEHPTGSIPGTGGNGGTGGSAGGSGGSGGSAGAGGSAGIGGSAGSGGNAGGTGGSGGSMTPSAAGQSRASLTFPLYVSGDATNCQASVEVLEVAINSTNSGCLSVSCPASHPYATSCGSVTYTGDVTNACIATDPNGSRVWFRSSSGTQCAAGSVSGVIRCQNVSGTAISASNCPTNFAGVQFLPASQCSS